MDAKPHHAELQRSHPSRPLDWRWQRAQAIVRQRLRRSRHRDDEATLRVCKYLDALDRCANEDQRHRVAMRFPDLFVAHQLTQGWVTLPRQVEARLLTSQDFAEIGSAHDLDAEVVTAYEQVFFDVRDRLDCSDWVHTVVIGPGLHRGFTRAELPLLWRLIAYRGGSLPLEVIMAVTLNNPLPTWVQPPDGSNPRVYRARVTVAARLAILAAMVPGPAIARAMKRLHALQRALEAATDRDMPDQDRMLSLRLDYLAGIEGTKKRRRPTRKRTVSPRDALETASEVRSPMTMTMPSLASSLDNSPAEEHNR